MSEKPETALSARCTPPRLAARDPLPSRGPWAVAAALLGPRGAPACPIRLLPPTAPRPHPGGPDSPLATPSPLVASRGGRSAGGEPLPAGRLP